MTTAILLAAGESKRMGKIDKRFLLYKDEWLVSHTIQQLKESELEELVIVRNGINDFGLTIWGCGDCRVVINADYKRGMTTSIQKGVNACPPSTLGYMICLADQPLLTAEEYNLLLRTFEIAYLENPDTIVVPFFRGQKGNPVIFSASYQSDILAHTQMDGCKEIIQQNMQHVVKVQMPTNHTLIDIDTPEAYEQLLKEGA